MPFPKTNSARAVQIQSFSAFLGPLILSVFLVFTFFTMVFREVTGMSVVSWCAFQKSIFLRRVNIMLDGSGKKLE